MGLKPTETYWSALTPEEKEVYRQGVSVYQDSAEYTGTEDS